jgi:hypothetical protein
VKKEALRRSGQPLRRGSGGELSSFCARFRHLAAVDA